MIRFLFLLSLLVNSLGAVQAVEVNQSAKLLGEIVDQHFTKWDKDKNGEISIDEINLAVIDPTVQGSEAAAVAALRRTVRGKDVNPADIPKLTVDAIKTLATAKAVAPDKPSLSGMFDSANKKLNKINRELFPKGKPNISALNQGKLGDCFCLAPLGAICNRNPEDITNMISKNCDGSYAIKLGKETMMVSAPTDAELALSASAHDDGIWVNVYEKALGAWKMKQLPEKERPITALDILNKGGSAGTILTVVTGHKVDRISNAVFKNQKSTQAEKDAKLKELRLKLNQAVASKLLVTTGTPTTITPSTPGINPHHAYAVLGFDEATDKIRIWNPHGQKFTPKGAAGLEFGYPTVEGVFEMPLPDFVKLFTGISIEIRES